MIDFACFVPHAPILLANVGSIKDHKELKSTLNAFEILKEELSRKELEQIIISSPHRDWGVKVPLELLGVELELENYQSPDKTKFEGGSKKAYPILTSFDSLEKHFEWGKEIAQKTKEGKLGWVASGDMAHTLKEDGPYGFNPKGPEFDRKFIRYLEEKNIEKILSFDNQYLSEAGVCGIWSFVMCLGAIKELGLNWEPEILSYEGPFGVGYLVANLKIKE